MTEPISSIEQLKQQLLSVQSALFREPTNQQLLELENDLTELIELQSNDEIVEISEPLSSVDDRPETEPESYVDLTKEESKSVEETGHDCSVYGCSVNYRCAVTGGSLLRHNGLVIDTEKSELGHMAVVAFSHPLDDSMLFCPYLADDRCFYGDDCRFSHGYRVPFDDLMPPVAVDFDQVSLETNCLVPMRYDEASTACHRSSLFHFGRVVDIDHSDHSSSVMVEVFHKNKSPNHIGTLISCPFNEILPLNSISLEDRSSPDRDLTNCASSSQTADSKGNIGAKLMAKMGYVPGKGLGKNKQGRLEPVEAFVLPKGKSLDVAMRWKQNKVATAQTQSDDGKATGSSCVGGRMKRKNSSVFNFLNKHLKTTDEKSSSSGTSSTPSTSTEKYKKHSKQELITTTAKLSQQQRELDQQIQSTQRSMERNKTTDPVAHKRASAKLSELEKKRSNLSLSLEAVERAQINRVNRQRLVKF